MFNARKEMITKEEMAHLSEFIGGNEIMEGVQVARYLLKDILAQGWKGFEAEILGVTMFEMGRIQGIREERARRK